MSNHVVTSAPWAKKGATSGPRTGQIKPVEAQPGPSVMTSDVPPEEVDFIETPKGFRTPTKDIKSQAELDLFLRSNAATEFIQWLRNINNQVIGKKLSDEVTISPNVEKMLAVLQELKDWLKEVPPIEQPMRYGNKAYRTWHKKVKDNARNLMARILPAELEEASVEFGVYLFESIGNATRIDYGTGHELAFVQLLYCGARVGVFTADDAPALVLRVFDSYINLMRAVQRQYLLEPAGSHGVWSLDDYQFLPFYFGAAQLRNQQDMLPSCIHDKHLIKDLKKDYMYFAAIDFINQMKTGPFGEHSPILNDISGVKTWDKVNTGMLKMWRAEVLSKFPVMQHFRLGTIFQWPEPENDSKTTTTSSNSTTTTTTTTTTTEAKSTK